MMFNKNSRLLFGTLMVVAYSSICWAVPAQITYQGRIDDVHGPVDDTLIVTFRLFDVAEAGGEEPLWEEVQSVPVVQGIFNVILGTGSMNVSYVSLEEALLLSDDLWLEVDIAGEDGPMSPRQKITSVGFAIRAGEAETVLDGSITTVKLADDAVTTAKVAAGAITADKIDGGAGSGVDADSLDGYDTVHFATSTTVTALQNQVTVLQSQVDTLVALFADVSRPDANTIRFSDVNVQIVNGLDSTETVNGTGNLIVGYNELRGADDERSGSHNVIVGMAHNYSSYGGLAVAYRNSISAPWASVSGGRSNTASGDYASVSGGRNNGASGDVSSVSGGWSNTASGGYASVSGGQNNRASGDLSFVGGGGSSDSNYGNEAFSHYSAVLGGWGNVAGDNSDPGNHGTGPQATVSGGAENAASGYFSSVGGGRSNTASARGSSISGGASNTASGEYSFVGGGGGLNGYEGNIAFANYSTILGGRANGTGDVSGSYNLFGYYQLTPGTDHSIGIQSSVSGGYVNIASGVQGSIGGGHSNTAAGRGSSISGGRSNEASGEYSFIGGGGGAIAGDGNLAVGHYTAILGGLNNLAGDGATEWNAGLGRSVATAGGDNTIGQRAVVSGGEINVASGPTSSISGGGENAASGENASISGGDQNTASGQRSSISGGSYNGTSGQFSSVSGGVSNRANGQFSSISGGAVNMADDNSASVSGGEYNTASGWISSVLGGNYNTANGNRSSVGGGGENTASGTYSSVSGGWGNEASGDRSSVSGGTLRSATNLYDWRAGHLFADQ